MNKILSTIIGFIFFGSIASAQLTEFSQGDILSAGAMNQNFKWIDWQQIQALLVSAGNKAS